MKKPLIYFFLTFASFFFLAYFLWVKAWVTMGENFQEGRIGLDKCHHCGMVLSDQRFVVSVQIKNQQGNLETLHFDDIGCFTAYAKQHPQTHWVGIAYDYESGEKISLEKTCFQQKGVDTPMGSGILAMAHDHNLNHEEEKICLNITNLKTL